MFMCKEAFEFIEKKRIYSFAEFVSICMKCHEDWLDLLFDNEAFR